MIETEIIIYSTNLNLYQFIFKHLIVHKKTLKKIKCNCQLKPCHLLLLVYQILWGQDKTTLFILILCSKYSIKSLNVCSFLYLVLIHCSWYKSWKEMKCLFAKKEKRKNAYRTSRHIISSYCSQLLTDIRFWSFYV